ncbi:MAG: hypothetical protein ACTSYD_06130 [Candidatus Heimdallarchaeaceae archaeon]
MRKSIKKFNFALAIGILIISVSMFAPGQTIADEVPPTVSTIAEYNNQVVLDGSADEYSNTSLIYVDIFPFESHDPPILLTATINFAYDDNNLYGFVFIPDTYGYVSAIELLFFGREDQGKTADGVWLNATENLSDDHAFDEIFQPPSSDVSRGGSNDVLAASHGASGGSYFEFQKPLNSQDVNGLDFNLYEGASIAVYLVAWVGMLESGEPNWGMTFAENDLRYIRLSIGYDNGEYLDIPSGQGKAYWYISDKVYQAYYAQDASNEFQADGYNNESFWVSSYQVRIYLMTENGYDDTNFYDGELSIAYDDNYIYIFLSLYDENDDDGDFTVFALSASNGLISDPYGMDIVSMDTHGYMDMKIDSNMEEPVPDTDVGGISNGYAYVNYYNSHRNIEFRKELNSGDADGSDLAITNLDDYAYILILAGYASTTGPNYADFTIDDQNNPALQVHPIKFLKEGETPTGTITEDTGSTDTNTFVIGFGLQDTLLITFSALMVLTVKIVLKRKRYH